MQLTPERENVLKSELHLKSNWLCWESDIHKKVHTAQLKLQENLPPKKQ